MKRDNRWILVGSDYTLLLAGTYGSRDEVGRNLHRTDDNQNDIVHLPKYAYHAIADGAINHENEAR